MQQAGIVVNRIITLGLIGLIGFISGRTGYLPENSDKVLAKILTKLTVPALIVTTMTSYSFSNRVIVNGIWIFVLAVIFLTIAYFLSKLVSSMFKLDPHMEGIYKTLSICGNIGFFALPLMNSMFGEKGLIYSMFYLIVNDMTLWTVGVYFLNRHNARRVKDSLKHFFNINTVLFAAGVIFIALNLHYYVNKFPFTREVYNLIYSSLNPLGKSTIYISMVFVGLTLAKVRLNSFSDIVKRYPIFVLAFSKLLLLPVVAFFLLSLPLLHIDPFVRKIIVLLLAMPSPTLTPALAAEFKSDYKFAAEGLFVTTLMAIFTLPLLVYIVSAYG